MSWIKKIKMIRWAAQTATQAPIAPPRLSQASRIGPSHSHNFPWVNCRRAKKERKTALWNVVKKEENWLQMNRIMFLTICFRYLFYKINTIIYNIWLLGFYSFDVQLQNLSFLRWLIQTRKYIHIILHCVFCQLLSNYCSTTWRLLPGIPSG